MTGPLANTVAPEERYRSLPAWVVFVVALTIEYLAVSFLVDAQDLLGPAKLEASLGRIGDLAPLAFLFPAAVVLTGGHNIRLRLRALSAYRSEQTVTLVLGGLFVTLVCGLLFLARLISRSSLTESEARNSLLLWSSVGIASVSALALSLWTPQMVGRALSGLRREFALGLLISSIAGIAGLLSRSLWKPLAWLTLELAHAILTILVPDPVASIEKALVGTERFYVQVAPVCSGIEGIALMLTFVGAYLFLARHELKWPLTFVLLPLSALFVWILNVVRIVGLILVGTYYSPEVALGGFHSKAGWVFFTLCALGTVHFVQQSSRFQAALPGGTPRVVSAAPQTLEVPETATLAYLAPLLSVLGAKLVTGLFTTHIDYFYGVSVVAAALTLYKFRDQYPRPSFGSPALPVSVGGGVAVLWIIGFGQQAEPSPVAEALGAMSTPLATTWLALRGLGMILTVPIVEELAFRGYMLRRFTSPDFEQVSYRTFSWLGLLISSLAFGALHSHWILGTAAGLIFGLVTVIRGRLSDAVVAHAAANALIFGYALLTDQYAFIS